MNINNFLRIVIAASFGFFLKSGLAGLDTDIIVYIGEPADGGYMTGVSNLRGWAVTPYSDYPITTIDYYIDGVYQGNIPYGGKRNDVCSAYNYPNCDLSGFSMAYNYNGLSSGYHTLIIIAIDLLGDYNEASISFTTEGLDSGWISPSSLVDFKGARVSLQKDYDGDIYNKKIYLENVWVVDDCKDIIFDWDTATQSWKISNIIDIQESFCYR